jgi:hypothetical protein
MASQMAGAMNAPQQPPPMPGPTQAQWYVAIDGQQTGPLSLDQLRAEVSAGRVNRQSLVWKGGMVSWSALEAVPELANAIGSTPPPLPK